MIEKIKSIDKINFLIALAGAIFFIPFLGGVHLFDWDEINFAESAREMIVTGDYLTVRIDFLPFWEKPPLFIWMQVLSMKIFGINEFAARLPNAIGSIVTLIILFNIGKRFFDRKFGLIWAMAYGCSFLTFFYFKSGIIDPWFNLFIFLGIYYFILYSYKQKQLAAYAGLSAFFIGLGILTKGPVALLIFGLTVFVLLIIIIFRKWRFQKLNSVPASQVNENGSGVLGVSFLKLSAWTSIKHMVLFIIILIVTGGFWFILQVLSGNYSIIVDFIEYQVRLFKTQDAGHGGFLMYHFVVLLIGVFPASVFALPAFVNRGTGTLPQNYFKLVMLILFWTVLILFTIVKTKIVHYSSMCYFPLTFLAAWYIYKVFSNEMTYKKWLNGLIFFIGGIFAILVLVFPFIDRFKGQIIDSGLIKDEFAMGNLEANVNWTGFEILIGLFLVFGLVMYYILQKKNQMQKAVITLFVSALLFISLSMIFIVPKVEGYSQRAAIEFYKELQRQDVYIETLGFKSYAHYFYARKQVPENILSYDTGWLLTGEIDKDAYFVIKIHRAERYLDEYPGLEILEIKNGFVFCVRRSNN